MKFTPSQIRYIICLRRLSQSGGGVKNVELATALELSKPSVHNLLKVLAERGVVTQESYGLVHFTDEGRAIAEKYEICFSLIERKMAELCGDGGASDTAVCTLLADIPLDKIEEMYRFKR